VSAQAKPICELLADFEQSLRTYRPATRRVYVAAAKRAIRSAHLELWQCPSRSVKNPSIATRRDTALIAALCAAPSKGTPRKWPENCLKIEGREVLLWDTTIEEPCFAMSLRFWHSWRERLARPDQRRLYRKSILWGQSRLLFPGPHGAPLSRAALHNALRRLNLTGKRNSPRTITPEKIRAAFLRRDSF
jgi:hypothetical protein